MSLDDVRFWPGARPFNNFAASLPFFNHSPAGAKCMQTTAWKQKIIASPTYVLHSKVSMYYAGFLLQIGNGVPFLYHCWRKMGVTVYVSQFSFHVQLQTQSVTWRFPEQKWMSIDTSNLRSLLKCYLNVTCLVVRVISISRVSIDAWYISSQVTLHVKSSIVQVDWRAFHFCASCCVSNVKNLQKLLSKIHIDEFTVLY